MRHLVKMPWKKEDQKRNKMFFSSCSGFKIKLFLCWYVTKICLLEASTLLVPSVKKIAILSSLQRRLRLQVNHPQLLRLFLTGLAHLASNTSAFSRALGDGPEAPRWLQCCPSQHFPPRGLFPTARKCYKYADLQGIKLSFQINCVETTFNLCTLFWEPSMCRAYIRH